MGTLVPLAEEDIPGIIVMFNKFGSLLDCYFYVKIEEYLLKNINVPENVKVVTEVEQQKLLAQASMKIFISQCGMNSVIEAMYAGVPIICLPFHGDQNYNSMVVEHLQIGIWLNRRDLADKIGEAIDNVMNDNLIYAENAKKLRENIHEKGFSLRNVFLDHVAAAIRN
ncbi:hypothetical protein ACQ4LE_000849 [Meloidogyne hapla]